MKEIYKYADQYIQNKNNNRKYPCKVVVLLFFEPSTRTYISFQSAIIRMGASGIPILDSKSMRIAKGESLKDTARMINAFADLVIIRSDKEGFPKAFSDYSTIPVVNAGDGINEHPTHAIIDFYTILRKKKIDIDDIAQKNLKIGLFGYLDDSRPIHSLSLLLSSYNFDIYCISRPEFQLPYSISSKLKHKVKLIQPENLDDVISNLDILYHAGIYNQNRKLNPNNDNNKWLRLTPDLIKKAKDDMILMHPLPRYSELSFELDEDKRSVYLDEPFYAVPIRMAIIEFLLSQKSHNNNLSKLLSQNECKNPNCITKFEKYLPRKKYTLKEISNKEYCYYCNC